MGSHLQGREGIAGTGDRQLRTVIYLTEEPFALPIASLKPVGKPTPATLPYVELHNWPLQPPSMLRDIRQQYGCFQPDAVCDWYESVAPPNLLSISSFEHFEIVEIEHDQHLPANGRH